MISLKITETDEVARPGCCFAACWQRRSVNSTPGLVENAIRSCDKSAAHSLCMREESVE